jgi:phage gp45-like
MASDDLENRILSWVERWAAGRYNERHGLVVSYDPQNYLAKVALQPEGQTTGWLPIETGHIGAGYGIAFGLTTGSGTSAGGSPSGSGGSDGSSGSGASNNSGDQVIVRPQEGDAESFKIVQRVHSQADTPPIVQSGEGVIWTKFGQKIFLDKNGNLFIQTGQMPQGGGGSSSSSSSNNGATVKLDQKGNITITAAENITVTGQQELTINTTQAIAVNGSSTVTVTAAAALNLNGAPINFNGGGPSTTPFSVPG